MTATNASQAATITSLETEIATANASIDELTVSNESLTTELAAALAQLDPVECASEGGTCACTNTIWYGAMDDDGTIDKTRGHTSGDSDADGSTSCSNT